MNKTCSRGWTVVDAQNNLADTLKGYASRTSPFDLSRGGGNIGKIWFACRQHAVQYTEWRMNKYECNNKYNFTLWFSVQHLQ